MHIVNALSSLTTARPGYAIWSPHIH